ncbi:MAG: DNA polymerase I [Saprospiraceae bacterium]
MSENTDSKKLFLLDGFALIFRAHFAFISRPMINSKGVNTSAIYGFVNTLWELIRKENPTHLALVLDPPGPTFRKEVFTEYKANRDSTPEDIVTAIPYIKEIVKAFNLPIIVKDNYEADDVIGCLAKKAEKEGFQVFMMTPDKDYAQLVSENIFMYKPSRKGNGVEILGVPEVLESWKIDRVEQVIDMLGLCGDSVDNIPGIPGIGPKTAQKLLAKYGSVEGLIENAHELKGKQKERVIEFAEQGLLSKELATIVLDIPGVEFSEEDCLIGAMNKPKLKELFTELEFRSISKKILGDDGHPDPSQTDLFGNPIAKKTSKPKKPSFDATLVDKNIENTPHTYFLMDTPEKRAELIGKLEKVASFCFDTETTGIDPNEAELVGIAFSMWKGEGYYVPVPADYEEAKAIAQEFKGVLESQHIEKVGQNLKYDILMMKWYGIEVDGPLFDTMIAHYLCEPDLRHNLNYLAETYLGYKMVSIETLIGKKGKNQLSMRDIAVDRVSEYAAEDADITLQLKPIMEKMLEEMDLMNLFNELEIPLIKVLTNVEYNGVRVNGDFLNEYSVLLEKQILEKENEIYRKAGTRFNIASPKQVGEVLFDRLKVPYRWKKTKTGQYSTNEEKLSELAEESEVIRDILAFRKLAKLKSTYVDALPRMINPKTGRIHTSYNQARAATGRLSSENPNLQNIPIRDEAGRKIRKAFIPMDENHVLLAADYSQIELRLIAEISGDKSMIGAFQEGLDIHRATAAKVYEVPLEEVTSDQRRNAKTVNFSIIYGAGATNLSKQLGIPRKEAKVLIGQYFKQYDGLKAYMDTAVEKARENGYVITLKGRKRYLRNIDSKNSFVRSHDERNAINTPIQGSAADMIKVAMIQMDEAFKKHNFKSKMILQVHDELVFDVLQSELEDVKKVVEEIMKNALPNLKVPILVGMDTGKDWLEAH